MNDRAARRAASPYMTRLLHNPLLHAALIVVLGLLAYANSFHVPFEYDDYQSLLELPYVQDLRYFTDWSLAREFTGDHNFRMRPVGNLTFAINYALHGTDVTGYHIVNLAIHIINALLVYCLVRLTMQVSGFKFHVSGSPTSNSKLETRNLVPLLAALLFVAHPIQTQAVTYIVQRLTSLSALFCLSCVVLYIKAREAQEEGERGREILWYGASVLSAILAMKTKEIAFTLPLAVCIYEFTFFHGEWKRRVVRLVPLLLTMLVIPLSLPGIFGASGETAGQLVAATRVDSDLSRYEYICTELRVIVTYLRLLVLPVNQNLLYDYPVYRTLLTPPVFLSFLLLLALVGLAVYLLYRSTFNVQCSTFEIHNSKFIIHNSPFYRLVSFGIFWFFLTLSVESSIIPIMDVIFEHRLYLPSVGAFIALAAGWAMAGERLGARVKWGGTAAIALAGLIVLALAGATHARNEVWRSQESLWQDVVNKSPAKAAGYQNLGIALFERGEIARAFACFDKALAIDPEFAEAYVNRGTLYAKGGRYDKAIDDFNRAVAIYPGSVEAWNNLGLAWSIMGDQDKAISLLSRSIALKPGYVKAYNNMGLALTRRGEPQKAIPYLDKALTLNRNYDLAYFNRGVAWKEIGRFDLAIADLTRAIELNPRLAAAYTHRGEALARSGARERAIADFRTACDNGDENGCRQLGGGR